MSKGKERAAEDDGRAEESKGKNPDPTSTPADNPGDNDPEIGSTTHLLNSTVLHESEMGKSKRVV